MTVATQFLLA